MYCFRVLFQMCDQSYRRCRNSEASDRCYVTWMKKTVKRTWYCVPLETGLHGLAMLSVDQHPVGYGNDMAPERGAPWRTYRCGIRSGSPPYRGGRSGGTGTLPSPSADSDVTASSFSGGPVSTSCVYHLETGPTYTQLHANLALKVETDSGSYLKRTF